MVAAAISFADSASFQLARRSCAPFRNDRHLCDFPLVAKRPSPAHFVSLNKAHQRRLENGSERDEANRRESRQSPGKAEQRKFGKGTLDSRPGVRFPLFRSRFELFPFFQFVHGVIDGLCEKQGPRYETFAKSLSLADFSRLVRCVEAAVKAVGREGSSKQQVCVHVSHSGWLISSFATRMLVMYGEVRTS